MGITVVANVGSVVIFSSIGVLAGIVLELVLKYFSSPIPYTVLLFYVGVALALIFRAIHEEDHAMLTAFTDVSADVIVYGFLPALLFSETMASNWYV